MHNILFFCIARQSRRDKPSGCTLTHSCEVGLTCAQKNTLVEGGVGINSRVRFVTYSI